MAQLPELCTPQQVAEALNTSDESVRRWLRDGLLPAVTLPSGRLRIRRADVEALLAHKDAS